MVAGIVGGSERRAAGVWNGMGWGAVRISESLCLVSLDVPVARIYTPTLCFSAAFFLLDYV